MSAIKQPPNLNQRLLGAATSAFTRLPKDIQEIVSRELDRSALDRRADIARLSQSLPRDLTANGISFTRSTGRRCGKHRRFLQMCSHYLVQSDASAPASGWEKGQVENRVGLVGERFFTPRLRFKTYEKLNAWLHDKCVAYAKAHRHVEQPERTIRKVFEEGRGKLVEYHGSFDRFQTKPASV